MWYVNYISILKAVKIIRTGKKSEDLFAYKSLTETG